MFLIFHTAVHLYLTFGILIAFHDGSIEIPGDPGICQWFTFALLYAGSPFQHFYITWGRGFIQCIRGEKISSFWNVPSLRITREINFFFLETLPWPSRWEWWWGGWCLVILKGTFPILFCLSASQKPRPMTICAHIMHRGHCMPDKTCICNFFNPSPSCHKFQARFQRGF